MALDDLLKRRVEKILKRFCTNRVPVELNDQIKIKFSIRGNNVTLFEKRRYYKNLKEWIKQKIA